MKIVFSIILIFNILYSKNITFSTMLLDRTSNVELEYKNLINFIEENTPYKFNFVFNTGYEDIVKKFASNNIDIVALDAVEYIKLKRFFPYAKAFLAFYDDKLNKFYTCEGVTKNKEINSLSNLNTNTLLRLHDKYSTCGYDIAKYILKQNNLNINNFKYKNVGIDDDVILEIMLNPNNLGFEKSNTLDKYKFFNLHIIKTELKVPTLALIVNSQKISKDITDNISKVLLSLKPLSNKKDKHKVQSWNYNTKNGSFIPTEEDYAHLYKILHKMETSKESK